MTRLRILTWHVHGNYLYNLCHAPHDFYLPVGADGAPGYGGRGTTFPFGANVHDVPADDVRNQQFDCIIYQSPRNYLMDRHEILSRAQQALPAIYLEHDPPRDHPTDTVHPVDHTNVLLVHVTHFNALMWDNGRTPVRVIEHGVAVPPGVGYTGELERGIVVVNNMASRGRRLGADIWATARREVPLDLVGMNAEAAGGLGEIPPMQLAAFETRYRFFFHPIRYTSLGLALCEAMMLGMPVVGLATTELATVITNGESGFIDTRLSRLIEAMQGLVADPGEAHRLGRAGQRVARERFGIERFVADWDDALRLVTGSRVPDMVAAGGAQ